MVVNVEVIVMEIVKLLLNIIMKTLLFSLLLILGTSWTTSCKKEYLDETVDTKDSVEIIWMRERSIRPLVK